MNYIVHRSAIVDAGASIGTGSKIWHFSHISSGAVIGENCTIGQNVYISDKALVGNNVKIQNNVSIYDNVVLEDDVFCGPSVVFTNVYNPRSTISRRSEYLNTLVKKGATLGANCTLVCGIEVGKSSFIGAGAVVNSNVPDFALMVGVPAKQIGWMSEFGERLKFAEQDDSKIICPHTGDVYYLKDKSVVKIEK